MSSQFDSGRARVSSDGQETSERPPNPGAADTLEADALEADCATMETLPLLVDAVQAASLKSSWVGLESFKDLPWWRTPSAFWIITPVALVILSFGGTYVVKLNLFLSIVCNRYFAEQALHDPRPHPNLSFFTPGTDNPQCNSAEVQRRVSALLLAYNFIIGFFSALVTPRLAEFSNRYGRARMMAISCFGFLASYLAVVIVAKFVHVISYHWILLTAVCDGLGGSFAAVSILTQTYVSDCTPPSRRSNVIAAFQGSAFIGMLIGPFLAGLLAKATGSLLSVFYAAAILIFGCMLFLLLVTPESLSHKQRQLARDKLAIRRASEATTQLSWYSQLGHLNPFAALSALLPRGPGTTPALRWNLVSLALADAVVMSAGIGVTPIILLYAQHTFAWDNLQSSYFISTVAFIRMVLLFTVLPILGYVLRKWAAARLLTESPASVDEQAHLLSGETNAGANEVDLWIIRASLVCDVAGAIGYFFSPSSALFRASGVLTSFGGLSSAVCQSSISKQVPPDRVGQILGACGFLQGAGRLIGPLVFDGLYYFTVASFPQAFLVVLASLYALALLLTMFVRPHVYMISIDETPSGQGEPENTVGR